MLSQDTFRMELVHTKLPHVQAHQDSVNKNLKKPRIETDSRWTAICLDQILLMVLLIWVLLSSVPI